MQPQLDSMALPMETCTKQSLSVALILWSTPVRHVIAQKWAQTPVCRDAAKTTKPEASPSELGLHLDETAPNLSLRDTGLPC